MFGGKKKTALTADKGGFESLLSSLVSRELEQKAKDDLGKPKDGLGAGFDVPREFAKIAYFAIAIDGDPIREAFKILAYIFGAGIVLIPILLEPWAAAFTGLPILYACFVSWEAWHRGPTLQRGVVFRLLLLLLSVACIKSPWLVSVL